MLNPQQRLAAETLEGPVLILAGAGSGKTRALTCRVANLMAHGVAAYHILALTFTNKAAKEMKERIAALVGDQANDAWISTFHSTCAKILRRDIEKLGGYTRSFVIYDDDDQGAVLKEILKRQNIDDKLLPIRELKAKISDAKNKLMSPDEWFDHSDRDFRCQQIHTVFVEYEARLKTLNALDFDDLLVKTLELLADHPPVLDVYRKRFQYVMVDEYQDTNYAQYMLVKLLTDQSRNLCVVGDDDQSIYSWRGAEIENILRFEKDFSDCKTIRLERNYRSTANILAAASSLISQKEGRLGKTLKVAENSPAMNCDNTKIKVISVYSGEDEAKYVVEEIEAQKRRGNDYSQMAVLVRTAFQTREFEEKFIAEAIPYQVIGGPKFYERAEIRDALAYFRVVLQPHDDLAFERIINKPARGIGAKTIEKFRDTARSNGISLYMAVEKMVNDGTLTGKAKTNMADLIDKFNQWRQAMQAITPDDLATQILEDSGYIEMLKLDNSVEAPGRLENLKELISVLSDHEKYPTLAEFLEHVSLVMDNDDALDTNKVMLITLHSAKGLEFDIVFLPGWEEGLFPHQRSLDEGGTSALEEERRLAYVAITRAKKQLYILTALNRRVYGQWQQYSLPFH